MKPAGWALLVLALGAHGLVGAASGQEPRRKVIEMGNTSSRLPFSPAIRSGETLYVSGMLGRDDDGSFNADAGVQTRQALRSLQAVLESAEMALADVVSANVYLADIRDFAAMNQAYREFFPSQPPVRTTVEAGLAARGALVEISLIAVDRSVSRRWILPEGWTAPASPYSYAILAGDTLYLSGAVSEDPLSGEIVPGTPAQQTRRALSNIEALLKAAGMERRHLVSSRVYLSDPRDFGELNQAYRAMMPARPPVRATVGARLALPELVVEIQSLAHRELERQVVGTPIANRPFSPGLVVGRRLFLAGMLGRGPDGLAAGDVAAQTAQALDNIERALQQQGLGFEDVIDSTVYLTDIRHFEAMNRVYAGKVTGRRPPRATVQTPLMLPEALVEIVMTAVVK